MSWEGSSWREPVVPTADRLRFALIVPRVLAPHPNRGPETGLRPDQALALAVLVRLGNLRDYGKGLEGVPKISEMGTSPDWGWRFVDAFRIRVLDENPGPLVTVANGAPDASSAAASAVAAACALLDSDRIEDAISLLAEALDRTDHGVVDRAWLETQRARLQRQVGQLEEAGEGARGARDALSSVAGDPTADAISAAAAILIERPGNRSVESFAATMIAGDTVAAWWRAQEVGRADNAIARRAFEGWARDRSVTFGGEDAAVTGLLAAAMMSSHSADQGGWAARHAAIGRDGLIRLDRRSDPDEAASALGELRIGGDDKSLTLAVARLLSDGPAVAVAIAARGVDLRRPTGNGLLADLALVGGGGDVLESTEAERLAGQLLEAIADPDLLAARTRPSFGLEVQLLGALTGILLGAGRRTWDAVIDLLPRLAPQEGQLAAREWANLVWTLPAEAWDTEDALRAAEGAARHDEILEQALLGVAWRHGGDPVARDRLIEAARAGSLSALGELGNVTALTGDVAGELISALAAKVSARTATAREGTVSFGGADPAEGLAVLNLWHQEVASWEPLLELLGEDAVPASYKRRVLVILAASAGRIPAEVKTRVAPILRRLQVTEPARSSPFDPEPDARGPALELGIATGAVDSKAATEITLPWLSGDGDRRRWAAHAAYRLARPEDIGVLCVLAADLDPSVRASASAALAALGRAVPGGEDPVAVALRMAEADSGVEVASAVAGALAAAGWRGELGAGARRYFRDHISAAVRAIAARDPDPDSLPGDDGDPGLDPFTNPYGRKTLEQLRG